MSVVSKRSNQSKEGLNDLCQWLSRMMPLDTVVEIGSWAGESATVFSKHFANVICVDPWIGFDEEYQAFLQNTKNISNIRHMKMKSVGAAPKFKDNSISFVYIDARHNFESVLEDITLWRPKARIIGGHDYALKGVMQAVDEVFGRPKMIFQDTSWIGVS